jgi:taurine dioxygenase
MHVNQADGGYEQPNFHTVTNLDKDGNILLPPAKGRENNNTSTWHSDKSYMPCPSMATFRHGIEVTREGGETLFASLTHSYDALEDAEKARLKQLRCVHHWAQSLRNSDSRLATAAEEQILPPVIHPLIRTHPTNGRKSLYVGFHASHIDGRNEEKGRAELFRLLDFATQDRFVYAHKWRAGDLVVWDNPSLVHKSAPLMKYKERRLLHRTVVRGSVPF